MTITDPAQVFRVEAQELLDQLEQGLLDLERCPTNADIIAQVFRALHTLKGSGAMFGFDALAAFAHHCESAFDRVRKGEVQVTPQLVAAVLSAQDHIRALAQGDDHATSDGEALIAAIDKAMNCAGPSTSASAAERTWQIRFSLVRDALVNGTRPLALLDELRALGTCTVAPLMADIPSLEDLIPTDSYLAWNVTLTTQHPKSAIEDVFIFVGEDANLSIEAAEPVLDDGVDAVDTTTSADTLLSDATLPTPANDKPAPLADHRSTTTGETVRVPAERLDELMNRVGELVIAQSRLKQVCASHSDVNLHSVSEEIERLAAELRDTMMSVRMVPISQLFGRFRRLIHDLARDTGKTIEFQTFGETTELDKTVIERLADPLIHLIRNAADHGLEGPEERRKAGKPDSGHVSLSARQAGAEVIISVSDDGRGVDYARVRAKAEQNGLIEKGATLSDNDVLQLLFHAGFSTAQTVTNISGRGVGMDVVKRTIEGLRGTIDIKSTQGAGSEVALRIPLTLAIIDGLLVRVGQGRYVIPLSSVEECVELTTELDQRSRGHCFLTLREQLVPFIRLRNLFATNTTPDRYQKVVVVSTGSERVGLVVDQILGDHQTVIKPLSRFHAEIETFSGATILGDGGVALILDVPHLVAAGQQQEDRLRAAG
ncbi:MAG: chemotaxis protein CheA [Rhizomicrobium sp.]|nr:chemotaxis protein CheA [Rhizomicrobium sp.]